MAALFTQAKQEETDPAKILTKSCVEVAVRYKRQRYKRERQFVCYPTSTCVG